MPSAKGAERLFKKGASFQEGSIGAKSSRVGLFEYQSFIENIIGKLVFGYFLLLFSVGVS